MQAPVIIQKRRHLMTTKDYQKKSGLSIFLSFFKPHRKLFALDLSCALLVSLIDLCYPIVSRTAMHKLLPEHAFQTFFLGRGVHPALVPVFHHRLLGPHLRHPRRGGHPQRPVHTHAGAELRFL